MHVFGLCLNMYDFVFEHACNIQGALIGIMFMYYVFEYVYAYAYVYVHVHACMCMCMHMCVYTHMLFMYVYICMHMYSTATSCESTGRQMDISYVIHVLNTICISGK
jgi:hypothetical protein